MEDQIRDVFPINLNLYMEAKHITPKQISDALGVTKTTVSEWRLGKKLPRMDKIEKLTKLFNVSKSDLLEQKVPPIEDGENNLVDVIMRELLSLSPEQQQAALRYIRFLKLE